jgi:hypothetical protein
LRGRKEVGRPIMLLVATIAMGRRPLKYKQPIPFFDAGWDFTDETENGTEDIWWILEGQDYPRLWWEIIPEN